MSSTGREAQRDDAGDVLRRSAAVDVVNRDAALAGLLITGVGDVFIPGGDMSSSYDDNWTELGDMLNMDVTPFDAVRHSAKPVVSAINGIAFGGGMMIAMLSDVAVASDRATFRSPEIYRGIADTHYSQILPQQVGIARARDLLLSGRTLTAAEACEWGSGHAGRAPRRVDGRGHASAHRVLLGRTRREVKRAIKQASTCGRNRSGRRRAAAHLPHWCARIGR